MAIFRIAVNVGICCFVMLGSCPISAAQETSPIVLKIGTLAPKGVGWANLGEEILVPATDRTSDGNVQLRLYFGGLLGDDKQVLSQMWQGAVDGGGFSGQGAVFACREFSVLELPFMFQNYDEVDHVRGLMFERFADLAWSRGLHLVYWLDQDFDQLYSTASPLSEPGHFAQARFVSWCGVLEERMLSALGARCVPASVPETNALIRQGQADAIVSTAIWVFGTQIHTQMKCFNPINIRYSPAAVMLSKQARYKVPEPYWERLYAIREDVVQEFVQATRRDNARCMEAMVKYGVQRVEMTPGEIAVLRDRTAPVWDQMADKLYPRELLDELTSRLEAFRAAGPGKSQYNSTN